MPALVTFLYPKTATTTFDLAYYLSTHMPLVYAHWAPHGLASYTVVELDGSAGYGVSATLVWATVEHFRTAARDHGEPIFADIKNYTNEKPLTLIGSEVGKSAPKAGPKI